MGRDAKAEQSSSCIMYKGMAVRRRCLLCTGKEDEMGSPQNLNSPFLPHYLVLSFCKMFVLPLPVGR